MQKGSLKVVKNRAGVKVWRAQWRESGKGRTRYLGRYADLNRAEARAEFDKILEPLIVRQRAHAPSALTLRRFVEDDYLVTKNRIWKVSSTRGTTEQVIETHILGEIGQRALASITRKELQALLDRKAEAGLSYSVVAHVRWQLSAMFKMARADGAVTIDPAEGLVTPKCKAAPEKRTITADNIRRAQMVLEIRERLIFRLAVFEGLRPGEIVGLKPGDYRGEMLHIERRIYRGVEDVPKSKKGRRPVALTDSTRALLEQWIEIVGVEAIWLFASENGITTLSYSNVYRRRIQPALNKVGLGYVNFQILRRTAVTEMSQVEPDAAVRAQQFGHGVDVHENEYRQANPAALKRAVKRLGRRLQ